MGPPSVQDAPVGVASSEGWEQVYRAHGERLWRSVLAYAGDPDLASEAVAEAFAQGLRRGDAVRSPEAWVWRAAFRIAAGALKQRSVPPPDLRQASYELSEPAIDLVAALGQLSPKQRSAVVLHHYAGYPASEIAAILHSTPAAVRVHLTRGRRRLRTLLEDVDDA